MSLLPGEAVINTNSEIVGLWDGKRVISADVLKTAMALYFSNSQKIVRPSFGFSYNLVTQSQSQLTGQPGGVLIKDVSAVAQSVGLKVGDVLTKIDSQQIDESRPLEEFLEKYKPGDQLTLTVWRQAAMLNIKLLVGELK